MSDIDYSRYYRRWHDESAAHIEQEVAWQIDLFGPLLQNVPRGAALDMGCALGCGMAFLERMGLQPVIGYDSDERQVESCLRRGLKVMHSADLGEVLKVHPGPYSVIMAIDFLEHLPPSAVIPTLRAVHTALGSGGIFLCRVPNANSAFASRYRYDDWTHYSSFTETSLDFVLFNGGFRDITILPAEKIPRRPPLRPRSAARWIVLRVARMLRRAELVAELGDGVKDVPLSLNILGVARK